jgi:hypothetical protein
MATDDKSEIGTASVATVLATGPVSIPMVVGFKMAAVVVVVVACHSTRRKTPQPPTGPSTLSTNPNSVTFWLVTVKLLADGRSVMQHGTVANGTENIIVR